MKDFELLGKSEQASTNGLNLFNYKDFVDPNTYDVKDGSYYRKYLQLKPNTKYTATVFNDIADNSLTGIFFIGATAAHDSPQANGYITAFNTNGKHSVSFNTGEDGRLVMKALGNATKLEEKFLRVDLIISEGNEIPYEPYTGGKPSPSPDYPQAINNVGKYNELTGKYDIEVMISGKNLLDISTCEDGKTLDTNGDVVNNSNGFLTDFIPCFPKTQYCRQYGHFIVISFYDVEKNKIGFINQYDSCFTTPDKCRYFRFSLNKTKADYEKAVANVGKELADYEQYRKPQYLTLSLDQPLRSVGKYKDKLTKDGVVRKIYKQTLKKEQVNLNEYNWETKFFRYYVSNEIKLDASENIIIASNISKTFNIYKGNVSIYWVISEEEIRSMGVTEEDSRTVANKKITDFVANNNIVIQYPIKEPILEFVTQSEQEAIRSLRTYYPTTVITTEGGEVNPDVEVTYIADTKNYIDQKIASVAKTVVETQKALL